MVISRGLFGNAGRARDVTGQNWVMVLSCLVVVIKDVTGFRRVRLRDPCTNEGLLLSHEPDDLPFDLHS